MGERVDLWESAAANRRNSIILVIVVMALALALGFFFMVILFPESPWWAGPLVSGGLAFVLTLIAFASGDSIVLASAGARHIGKPDAPQLWNVVEEMAIASGLPMPEVYLIEDSALNAFATGRKPETASVAITRGLLDRLNREELQGVMAHEMSHVGNRDILFATLMAVMVGSIVLISDILLRSLFWGGGRRRRSSSDGDGKAQAILMVVGIAFAILAPIFAKILQMAVSRQREYLADATAARLTRNPRGLASALRKLTADTEVLEAANRATAHLFIVNPIQKFKAKATGIFSTHPPIEDRIERLLGMAGEFPDESD